MTTTQLSDFLDSIQEINENLEQFQHNHQYEPMDQDDREDYLIELRELLSLIDYIANNTSVDMFTDEEVELLTSVIPSHIAFIKEAFDVPYE